MGDTSRSSNPMDGALELEARFPTSEHRDYYLQSLHNGLFAHHLESVPVWQKIKIDSEAAVIVILAILCSDQIGLEEFLGGQPKIHTDFLARLFLRTLAKVPNAEILRSLNAYLRLSHDYTLLITKMRGWIREAEIPILRLMVAEFGTVLGHTSPCNLFQWAWRETRSDLEPEDPRNQLLSIILPIYYQEGTTQLEIAAQDYLSRFISSRVHHRLASSPLLWTLEHLPIALEWHRRPILLHRWALQDELVVLGMMAAFGIDREQMIAWYDDHDHYLTAYHTTGWMADAAPLPAKFALNSDWIIALLSRKSARSSDVAL